MSTGSAHASGGSIALEGFLYQILSHLSRAASFVLRGEVRNQSVRQAELVLEPRSGGGDARYTVGNLRIVEQYKTRNRSWGLSTFAKKVLPDLVRAALEPSPVPTVYSFVTDAPCTALASLGGLRDALLSGTGDAGPVPLLDNATPKHRWGRRLLTDRAVYSRVGVAVRKGLRRAAPPARVEAATKEVLARLEIRGGVSAADLRASVDRLLRSRVETLETVEAKRSELCGILLSHMARGEALLTPEGLLKEANLVGIALDDDQAILESATGLLTREERSDGYSLDLDVRPPPEWPSASHALVVSGESGVGKTWTIHRLARKLIDAGELAVFVRSAGDFDRQMTAIAEKVWQSCLRHTSTTTLEALAERVRQARPGRARPWLTVVIDTVESSPLAREFLDRVDLRDWGIRLVFSTADHVAEAVFNREHGGACRVQVGRFTHAQLRQFADRRGVPWATIPPDLRDLLCLPFLASIYCEVNPTPEWTPRSEYEVVARAWERASRDKSQADHPSDRSRLRDLAALLLDPSSKYPWSAATARQAGLDDEALRRLEAVGWLRRASEDAWGVPHPRLLGWAAAEALVHDLREDRRTHDDVVAVLHRLDSDPPSEVRTALEYVLMDTIWILVHEHGVAAGEISSMVEKLHVAVLGWPRLRNLVEGMLPTMGRDAVPILMAYLRQASTVSFDERASMVKSALAEVASAEAEAVRRVVADLLKSPDEEEQSIGLFLLRVAPDGQQLERAWTIHQRKAALLDGPPQQRDVHGYSGSAAAIRAAVRSDPEWLRRKIQEATEQEPVHELVWFLLGLDDLVGRALWWETKSRLLRLVRPEKIRCCCHAIGRYRDTEEEPLLLQLMRSGPEDARDAAFCALTELSPDRAVEAVGVLDWDTLYYWRGRWLAPLSRARPTEIGAMLLQKAESSAKGWWDLAILYQGQQHLAPPTVVRFVLEGMDEYLEAKGDPISDEDAHKLYHPLEFLARVRSAASLDELRLWKDKGLPTRLLRAVHARADRPGDLRDNLVEHGRLVLLRMESSAFANLLEIELSAASPHRRLSGIRWTPAMPSRRALRLLRQAAATVGGSSMEGHVQSRAIDALASLGARRAVLRAVVTGKFSSHVPDLLASRKSTDAPAPESVLRDLLSPDGDVRRIAIWRLFVLGHPPLTPAHLGAIRSAVADDRVTRVAMIVLLRAGDHSPDCVRLLSGLLRGPHHELALSALLRAATEDAIAVVRSLVEDGPMDQVDERWWEAVEAMAEALPEHEVPGRAVAKAVENGVRVPDTALPLVARHAPLAGEALLYKEAFDPSPLTPSRRLRAIEGLRLLDSEAAGDATLLVLTQRHDLRIAAADLALRIETAAGVGGVLDAVVADGRESVAAALGRALRRGGPHAAMESSLAQRLAADSPRIRRTAAWVAGWLPRGALDPKLRSQARDDEDEEARHAAQDALDRIELHEWGQEVLIQLGSASRSRRWGLVTLLVARIDPHVLGSPKDPLWIWPALGKEGTEFEDYLDREFRSRRSAVEKKEQERDAERAKR